MRSSDPPHGRTPALLDQPFGPGEDSSHDPGAMQGLSSLTWIANGLAGEGHHHGDAEPRLQPRRARLGKYYLIELLARGGQAEVWKAVWIGPTVVLVAIKLLAPDRTHKPRKLARFLHEAHCSARLDGPALLPINDYGVKRGFAYLVMPWVDGFSLAAILDQRRRCRDGRPPLNVHRLALLPEPQYLTAVVRALAPIARALQAAHAARVVHCDVKPANILLDRHDERRIYLVDFGLGCDLDAVTPQRVRDRAGTPLYMAPEKLLGCQVDEVLCDVYSLGMTLFEAVTLTPPRKVPEALPGAAWAAYLAGTEPPRPRAVRPDLPAELDALVARATERDPERRYPSAEALAADLDRFLAGAPAEPQPRPGPSTATFDSRGQPIRGDRGEGRIDDKRIAHRHGRKGDPKGPDSSGGDEGGDGGAVAPLRGPR